MSYIAFKLIKKQNSIFIKVLTNNIRVYLEEEYQLINKVPLSNKVSKSYKNLGYRRLMYKTKTVVELHTIPDKAIKNNVHVNKDEVVYVENEYKNFIFIVKYNKKNEVEKFGWVEHPKIVFVKEQTTKDKSHF